MPQRRIVDLHFPTGGLHKALGFQKQPPYTTPDCLNVRPTDTLAGRERGGSRPGLVRAFPEQLGSGSPVRMLGEVTCIRQDGLTYDSDDFSGSSLGSNWTTASWIGTAPAILPSDAADLAYGTSVGAVRADPGVNSSSQYYIEIYIVPWLNAHQGSYQIFGKMNGTTPVATTDGFVAELVLGATGAYSGTLKVYNASAVTSYTFTPGDDGAAMEGWFSVLVNSSTITCTWRGATLKSQACTFGGSAGVRAGFGMTVTAASGVCLVDAWRLQYYANTTPLPEVRRTFLLASAGGSVYKTTWLGHLTAISSNLTLNSSKMVLMSERVNRAYVADHGIRVSGSDGTLSSAELDSTTITDWTLYGIDVHDDVCILTDSSSNVEVHAISAVDAGKVTLATTPSLTGTLTFRIERGPKIIDPVAATISIWTATTGKGYVPVGCSMVATYRDRMVLAGDPTAPHAWYMSRQGDPLDWDYGEEDAQRALLGTTEVGRISEPVTAIVPHGDDYLIIGGPNSLWMIRGDPAYGGFQGNLSRQVGIIDRAAWCWGPAGELFFLSKLGLYVVAPGVSGHPQAISEDKLPDDLRYVDTNTTTVSMAYDFLRKGVLIYLSPNDGRAVYHWFFDLGAKGFWPESHATAKEPTCAWAFRPTTPDEGAVLLGSRDGYVRRHSDTAGTDDGTAFNSHVFYGPMRLGGSDNHDGLLSEINSLVAIGSGAITETLYTGDGHESALTNAVYASNWTFTPGTWTYATSAWTYTPGDSGKQFTVRPHRRGGSALLKLSNAAAGSRWAVEAINTVIERRGKARRG